MTTGDIVLLSANPRQLGIIRDVERDGHVLVEWLPGVAWMHPSEVVLESQYRRLHLDKPTNYDIFDNQPQAETVMTVPAQTPQANEPDEKRRAELESLTVPQLKEHFQLHGPHWRKFANSARKQELVEQLLAWEEEARPIARRRPS